MEIKEQLIGSGKKLKWKLPWDDQD